MSQDIAEPRLPDIVLERYRLNELPPAEYDGLSDRLRRDEALRLRLASLDQSDVEIRRNYQPEIFIRRVPEHLSAPRARRRFARWAIPAMLAATLTLIVALPTISRRQDEGDRIKGLLPGLSIYRKTDTGSETLAYGAAVRRGDVIRLGYRAAGRTFGVILSIDGRGTVTLHLPPNGNDAAPLRRESTVLLDQAYELDDAPRWEQFYFVTSQTSFAIEPVMDAARRAAATAEPPPALGLPRGLEQAMFMLKKEESR